MDKPQTVEGRILRRKHLGGILFIELETIDGPIQIVARREAVDPKLFELAKALKSGDYCWLSVRVAPPDVILLSVERHIERRGEALWDQEKIERTRGYSFLLQTIRNFFYGRSYHEVSLPSIHYGQMKGEAFAIDFFGSPARLTSSNALYLDLYAAQLHRVFSMQPCFRAEPSHTRKHLAEFTMLEIGLMNRSLDDAMRLMEELFRFVYTQFESGPFNHLLSIEAGALPADEFSRKEYRDIEREYQLNGKGLGKHETEIAANGPVFVTNFPRSIASWTARPVDENHARSFNLLLPGVGETAEGAERQTKQDWMAQKIKLAGVEEQLRWYPAMMPYTDFQLTSMGLGVERLAMWLFDCSNIRDVKPIYRDTGFSEIPKRRKP